MGITIDILNVGDKLKEEITDLTCRATKSSFYRDDLDDAQIAANRRIVDIAYDCCLKASQNENQMVSGAWQGQQLIGFVISSLHGPEDRELDWLMVDPDHHGKGIADQLMRAGLDWLDPMKPIWLNVIAYNDRAIGFYRRYGFKIDETAKTGHTVPHEIMRRAPAPLD